MPCRRTAYTITAAQRAAILAGPSADRVAAPPAENEMGAGLLREIENFLKAHNMAQTAFGRHAVNDSAFVGQLRQGSATGPKRAARVRAFMRGYQP